MWLLYHDRLSTKHYLHRLGVTTNSNYPLRDHPTENLNHIFLQCPNATTSWDNILHHSSNPHQFSWVYSTLIQFTMAWKKVKIQKYNAHHTWEYLFPQNLWTIWLRRNNNLFNNKKDPVEWRHALNMARKFYIFVQNPKNTTIRTIIVYVKWESLNKGIFMLNIDGVVHFNPG